MELPLLLAGAAATMLLLITALVGVVVLLRARRGATSQLAQARAEAEELRRRLEELTERLERQTTTTMLRLDDPACVITDAGEPTVADRVVLSATVGEPLVKVVAFGHGLRRALSAESRNTIRFEMRREVRRARKQRRREMKQAWRQVQAEERASYDEPEPAAAR